LRVEDYALPNFLEDFYMDNESYSYAERFNNISCNGDSSYSDKSTSDKGIHHKNGRANAGEDIRVMPRGSKRRAKPKSSSQDVHLSPRKSDETEASQKKCNYQQCVHEGHTAKIEKCDDDQKPKNSLYILKYQGRKYQCLDGVLTPAQCEDSPSVNPCGEDGVGYKDHDENAPKTGSSVKMRNGVVKRKLTKESVSTDSELLNSKKSRSSQSPKVLVHNCFQQIAISQTKLSKTVTTASSSSTVGYVQRTTEVRKRLFPVESKRTQSAGKCASQMKTKLGSKSVQKKQDTGRQKRASTKCSPKETVEKKHPLSTDVKVSEPTKDTAGAEVVLPDSKKQKKLSVQPIIRIHQGLKNTSLKQFKARQCGKDKVPVVKKNPHRAFPCSHCEKRFKKAGQVEKHFKDDHKCSHCEEVLKSKVSAQCTDS
jgi:hypothetical protein